MADASTALGAPQVAGAWVNRLGRAKRAMSTISGAEIGGIVGSAVASGILAKGSPQPAPDTPAFGAFGYLAVSASDLVLVKGKQGLLGLKMTDDVVGRSPRSEVASIELGDGKLAAPLTITFTTGVQWELEVARANRGAARKVVDALGG